MKNTIAFLLVSSLLALTAYGIPCPPEFCPSVSITDIFIKEEVCVASGWTIRNNIPYYYLKELQDSYLEVECRLLASINSYPTDIGNYLDTLCDSERTFDVVVNEVDSGNFDTIRLLLELGKTVLVLNEGGYPSFTSSSLYNRVNLFGSSDYVHQYRVDISGSSYTKNVYSSKMLGGLANLDDNTVLLPPEYYVNQISALSDLWSYDKLRSVYSQYEKTTTKTTTEECTEVCSTPFGTYISHEERTTTETTTIKSAFSEIGYNVNPYSASISAPGFYSLPSFRKGEKNVVITNEYLKYLAQQYPNLKLSLFTRTKRVVFENQRVTKVIVETIFGVEVVIYVNDYFIFGGHPLETMQLMFNSGFGSTDLLQRYGITSISSSYNIGKYVSVNPVYYGCVLRVSRNSLYVDLDLDSSSLSYLIGEPTLNPAMALNQYRLFLQSSKSSFIDTQISTYIFTSSSRRRLNYFAKYIFQWSEQLRLQILAELDCYDIVVFGIELINSRTTSYVVFEGDSPVPVIKTDMFSNSDDIEAILEAINEIKRLTQTSIFSSLSVQPLPFSLYTDTDIFSSNYIKQSIIELSAPSLYLSGGLPIGNSIDDSIVDFYCRMHQYPNVLVINNGILPVNFNFGSAGLSLVIGNYATSLLISTYEKKTYELYYSSTSSSLSLSDSSLNTGFGIPSSTIISTDSSSSESLEQSSSSSTIIGSGLGPVGGLSPVCGLAPGSGIVASQSSSSSEYESDQSSSSYLSTGGIGGIGGIGSGIVASQSSSSSEYESDQSSSSYLSSGGLGGIGGLGSGVVASQSSSSSEYESDQSSSSYLSSGGLGGIGGLGSGVVASQSSSSSEYEAEQSNSEYYSSGGLGGGSVVAKSSSSSVEAESESEKSSFASYGNGGFVSASSEKESSSYDAESESSYLSVC